MCITQIQYYRGWPLKKTYETDIHIESTCSLPLRWFQSLLMSNLSLNILFLFGKLDSSNAVRFTSSLQTGREFNFAKQPTVLELNDISYIAYLCIELTSSVAINMQTWVDLHRTRTSHSTSSLSVMRHLDHYLRYLRRTARPYFFMVSICSTLLDSQLPKIFSRPFYLCSLKCGDTQPAYFSHCSCECYKWYLEQEMPINL